MRRINDIFYSLQGEGYNTGRAAVFVRFAGCNLRCPFCDTAFDTYREMTDDEILTEISRYEVRGTRYENTMEADSSEGSNLAPRTSHLAPRKPLVVLTGGEPTLQVDEAFVDLLHRHGFEVAMDMTSGSGLRVVYFDCRDELGTFIEVNAPLTQLYEGIKAMHENWDGSRPLRPIAELMGK